MKISLTNGASGLLLGSVGAREQSGKLTRPSLERPLRLAILLLVISYPRFFAFAAATGNTSTGAQSLSSDTTGYFNTADGSAALFSNTSGSNNTAVGYQAGYNLTTGTNNVALGSRAGRSLTTGNNNIDIGNQGTAGDDSTIRIGTPGVQASAFIAGAINGNGLGLSNLNGAFLTGTIPLATLPAVVLTQNEPSASLGYLTLAGTLNLPATTAAAGFINFAGSPVLHAYGAENFFGGTGAGNFTLTGSRDVGLGAFALGGNTSGSYNTASGDHALSSNSNGNNNTASGASALQSNVAGGQNTANGAFALSANTSGNNNMASGNAALGSNTAGGQNTANGTSSLYYNTNGNNNTASGFEALASNTSGNNNIGLGYLAGFNLTTGNNNIDIGNQGLAGDDSTIRIGTPGTHTTTVIAGAINGNGSGLTSLSAAQLVGTIPLIALPMAVVTQNEASATLGSLTLNGTLSLPATTAAAGFISFGGSPVLHAYGAENFFGGTGAGNFTLTGSRDVGLGAFALGGNTSGSYNTASGDHALSSNSNGNNNTASGASALQSNVDGGQNTANGAFALSANTSGNNNMASGDAALAANTAGGQNTANGTSSLYYNTNGNNNTASGFEALFFNTSGNNNIGLGCLAGLNLTTGNNNIDIGNQGVAGDDSTIRIGTPGTHASTFIAGAINGNGSGLTNLAAESLSAGTAAINISGNAATATSASTANSATDFTGSLVGDVSGSQGATSVQKIQGVAVSSSPPSDSQVLLYSAAMSQWVPGIIALAGDVTGAEGATVVSGVGGQPAATIANAVLAVNGATSANLPGAIVKRDATSSFSATNITLDGTLNLPATTGTAGFISFGGIPILHAYGPNNLFAGAGAGNFIMSEIGNVGLGPFALGSNTFGSYNTASGFSALANNTVGLFNTANGAWALANNRDGGGNTASGLKALISNTDGSDNTASGSEALGLNTSGNGNTAIGSSALVESIGNNNIGLGASAGYYLTTGNNNIDIGNQGVLGDDSTIRIGTQGTQTGAYIAGISGATVSGGVAVYVNPSGQLGTLTSSARFKQEIQHMGEASDVLLALRPVTFRYKPEIDPQGLRQYGLVAEDVEKVDPDLVARDDQGQPYSVRYEAVNAMLLNEFLKEHEQVSKQSTEIQGLKERLERLEHLLGEHGRMIRESTSAQNR